jgi:hypothetical protein
MTLPPLHRAILNGGGQCTGWAAGPLSRLRQSTGGRPGMPRDRGQPAARAQEHGRRRLRRRSSSGRAAQATGPLLRPPGRSAFPAEMACGHPGPRRPRRPLGQEERAGAGPAPARRAARRPVLAGSCRYPDARKHVNWRSIVRRRGGKITRMQARAPVPVTSSQQSHLAKLRHTEPGVHGTRDAPQVCYGCESGFLPRYARGAQPRARAHQAIPPHEPALAAFERVLGPDHPSTLTPRNNLATARKAVGQVG